MIGAAVQDLNDLYFFAQVVEHGGFAAASRALGVPKSKLSRRIAGLEERLGVRLIQRSTRRFSVTELGQEYHRHCLAMIAEAGAAQDVVDRTRTEPRGLVRLSCPVLLAQGVLAQIVSRFLSEHPGVRIHVEATNRRVDVIDEGFDLALRVRETPLEDTGLIVRTLGEDQPVLVASPGLLARQGRPRDPADLFHTDSVAMSSPSAEHAWTLSDMAGNVRRVPHRPRLVTDELLMLQRAALDGIGVAELPAMIAREAIASGRLERVLPEWRVPSRSLHAVFPSRRGLIPAVRLFIDALAASLKCEVEADWAPRR
ncbi:LysR substrate-binding domain-containing protein [Arenibaculum pallidiluteum]|uniref:LysR substrate-binding domain-containing protein n=1 Tax=Arenibaculum pallidiluteum TaxID=2812559 RepID=UPI001B3B71F3|nr:LysR substrate-binding domain-containing protein [Arenibaculum pallidiluteum]